MSSSRNERRYYMKKLLSIFAAAALILTALTSCNMPFSKPAETETQTETTTIPQPDFTAWEDKYEEFLHSVINGNQSILNYELEVEDCRFGVKYIDDDDIPELLISEGEFPGSKVSIFGYDGFEIRLIGSVGVNGEFDYIPRGNVITSFEPAEGQDSFIVYSIEDFKIKETFNATRLAGEEGFIYLINEDEVTQEEYDRLLGENSPEETETVGRNLYELRSEYVLPVVESNTDLIDKAIEENSLKNEAASPEEAEYAEATPDAYAQEYSTLTEAQEDTGITAGAEEYQTSGVITG